MTRKHFLGIFIVIWCAVQSIQAQTNTTVQSGNWNSASTWDCGCVPPTGQDAVIAAGHLVTLTAAASITNFTINEGGRLDYNGNTLTVSGTVTPFISQQTGNYSTASTWLNGSAPGTTDRVIIVTGHSVTTTANTQIIANITVDEGAVLSTANNKDIAITQKLTVNGTLKLNQGNADLRITTASVNIGGTGTFDGSESTLGAIQVEANASFATTANLLILGDIDIDNGITLTNNGTIQLSSGNITGGNASSQFTMGSNAELEIAGTLMTTGILSASASGNSVEYNNAGAQTIKNPASSTYHNLLISGTGIKTFPASALTLNGNLTISSGTLNINNQNITIKGNWTNEGAFTNIATTTFDGTINQQITTAISGQNFGTMVINKSSGQLVLNNNEVVTTAITMTAGNINTGSFSLTLGSGAEGTLNYTAGRIIGTFGRYIATGTTAALNYPIGTSSNNRTVSITFDQTGGGRSAGVVFASFVATDPGNAGFPVTDDVTLYNTFNEGYWDFSVNGFSKGASNSFDLGLTGNGFTSFTIGTNTRVVARDDSGTDWNADGSHNTVSGNTVSRNNITTFPAQFAFGDDTNCSGPADPVITGNTEVCTNDANNTYTVTLNSGNDYNWTVVGGTIDEAGGGTTTGFTTDLNTITVDWGSTGQAGSVSVIERNTCTSSNEVTLDVNINSIAPSSISGNIFVAENTTGVTYSVTNQPNTTYNWTITGGTQVSGGTTNSITVDWGSAGTGTVDVTATKTTPSCPASSTTSLSVTIYNVIESAATGDWNDGSTWVTGSVPLSVENAKILSVHTVSLAGGGTNEIRNLVVEGTLNINSRDIDVSGDLTINSGASVTGTSGILGMTGTASSPVNKIDGTGTLNGGYTIEIRNANKAIGSTAVISQSGTGTIINIDAGLTVTNRGSITIGGNITGDAGTSTWTNASGSTLTIGGALLATGTLNAHASTNSVVYNSTTAANIKPATSGYSNLEIRNGTKSLTANADVNNNLTLTSGTFAMSTFNTTVAGNLTYTAGSLTGTGTITLDGSTNQVVLGAWSLPNLTVNNTLNGADAITLSSGITVSTLLTLTDGIVGTGTNVLTVSAAGTGALSGGSSASFVNGRLARQTNTAALYDFPVGKGTTYKRVGITPTTTAASTFRVEGFNVPFSDITTMGTGVNDVSGVEYWDIQRTSGTAPAQIRLYWNTQAASNIETATTDLLVAHYTGGQWEDQANGANSGDVDPGYIESGIAIATFSPVTFGSASAGLNPLPVELSYFGGFFEQGTVILEWITESEINNDFFEVERSTDGRLFESVGRVGGFGNSSVRQEYRYVDRYPLSGLTYYRLKQVDIDGQFEYSKLIALQNTASGISLYPNPVSNTTKISLGGDSKELEISLHSLAGVPLFSLKGELATINEEIQELFGSLKAGIYVLKVSQGQEMKHFKLVKE